MDLDELQSVQSRERQTDSLQQLRATFYQDAAEYVARLEAERDRAAEEADDPWTSGTVGRLNDDIDTATQTIEAIYERRVGKIVKMASLAAADMPTDHDGLTEEEEALFDSLVAAIEDNRGSVFAILDGESSIGSGTEGKGHHDESDRSGADPTISGDGDAGVDAADVMGGDSPTDTESDDEPADPRPGDTRSAPDGGTRSVPGDPATFDQTAPSDAGPPESGPTAEADVDGSTEATGADSAPQSGDSVERATVRITDDVGEIFGVDERAYDLTAEDVVVLPEANAGPLVEQGAAERLD